MTPRAGAGLAVAALAVAALAFATAREAPPRAAGWAAAALAGVALVGLLQSLAWPAGLARALSPRHSEIAAAAAATRGLEPPTAVALSLAPDASRAAALDWVAAAAALAAAASVGAARRGRRTLAVALVGGAMFQVLFGAQQWFARSDTLWGVDLPAFGARLRGTFVNPNHAALYLEIALAVVFAWGYWSVRRAAAARAAEERLVRAAGPILVWLLLFAGLAFTRSRAGLLVALVVVALQGAGIGGFGRRRWVAVSGLVVALAGVAVVAWLGFDEGLGRLLGASAEGLEGGGRPRAARATIALWLGFPLLGTGLGSFRAAFPLVQPPDLPGLWRHAHNDWVELGATAGLLGFALVTAALVPLVRRLAKIASAGARSEDRAAGLAALGALAAAALHSLVDFGLTVPANAVTLAALVGAATAADVATAPPPEPQLEPHP